MSRLDYRKGVALALLGAAVGTAVRWWRRRRASMTGRDVPPRKKKTSKAPKKKASRKTPKKAAVRKDARPTRTVQSL